MDADFDRKVRQIMKKEAAYSADAYCFVAQAVTFTVEQLEEHRHVTALELLKGVRKMAAKEYGVLAREVLKSFGILYAADVGKIVYLLIGAGLLSASEDDRPEEFEIDFEPAPEIELVSASSGRKELPVII